MPPTMAQAGSRRGMIVAGCAWIPAAAAGVVEGELGVLRERKASFGLRSAEVERRRRGDAPVQRRGHRTGVAAAGRLRQENNLLRIDPFC